MILYLLLGCVETNMPLQENGYQWGDDSGVTNDTARPNTNTSTGYEIGERAPDISLQNHAAEDWSLYAQNKPILLIFGHLDTNFMPGILEQLNNITQNPKNAVIIGRNRYSMPASTDDIVELASQYDLDVVLNDPSQELINQWTQSTTPLAYLLDSNQIILWKGFQWLDENRINQLLSE